MTKFAKVYNVDEDDQLLLTLDNCAVKLTVYIDGLPISVGPRFKTQDQAEGYFNGFSDALAEHYYQRIIEEYRRL